VGIEASKRFGHETGQNAPLKRRRGWPRHSLQGYQTKLPGHLPVVLQVVILPVALGLLLNAKARPLVDKARPFLPLMAIVCTSLCIGSPLAFNADPGLLAGAGPGAPCPRFPRCQRRAGVLVCTDPWH